MSNITEQHLNRLLSYLAQDPANTTLLVDTIQASLNANSLAEAERLVRQLEESSPGSFEGSYFTGMLMMKRGSFVEASERFADILNVDDGPAVRFNLAWSLAMTGEKAKALEVLDDPTVAAISDAAMLKMQLMHEAGQFEEAVKFGNWALMRFPDDAGLLAAMSTLALDIEDINLARDCARKAGTHPEALAATGVLNLADGDVANAAAAFDRSIAIREFNPRAWLGRGLVDLVQNNPVAAAQSLDRGAEQFNDHIGSWIAAGWARYLSGEIHQARARFARALELDQSFAESQGSMAVVDIAAGDFDSARHRIRAALKLDKACFSAALAQVLLTTNDPEKSQEIVRRAFETPLNDRGLSLASYLAGLRRPTLH